MGKFIDLTGKRFGRLLVISRGKNQNRDTMWNCICECGNKKIVSGSNLKRKTKSCGCFHKEIIKSIRGPTHPSWKGGKITNGLGYVFVNNPKHPNANKRGYVLEHILVMSTHLERPLQKGETVHHKNGIRSDNRIENLELWANSHPSGQRLEDVVAHEIWHLQSLGYKITKDCDI